jgi:ankyrin repeat protein
MECNNFTYGDVERLLMLLNRFRWVFCQLEVLQDCLPSSVRRTLKELPESLDETYERILREIKRPSRDHARRLLQCLVVAIRPLRVEELAELLAYDFDATEGGGIPEVNPNWRWEDHEQAVLSTCSSLIAVVRDGRHRVVQFSHFSVKEFLTSSRLATSGGDVAHHCISLELAHTLLAQACLGTLLSLDDQAGSNGSSLPLAEYAAQHWVGHAQVDKVSPRVQAGMQQLFDPSKPHLASWIQMDNPDKYRPSTKLPLIDPIATSLYYAALCGFPGLVEHLLIKYPEHVDAFGGGRGAPLHAASARNRVEVAQLLLKRGGDANVRGHLKRAPLHFATLERHLEMVRFLLDHGADVDSRQGNFRTSLHIASRNGYADISQILLEHKADMNSRDDKGQVPLHQVSDYNHGSRDYAGVAQLLLEHSADVGEKDEEGTTPLHLASFRGRVDVVRLLLDHGTNVDVVDKRGRTPLHLAVSYGRQEVVRLLLDHGANADAEDESGRAPLQVALENEESEIEIVQMLTEHGAQLHREL